MGFVWALLLLLARLMPRDAPEGWERDHAWRRSKMALTEHEARERLRTLVCDIEADAKELDELALPLPRLERACVRHHAKDLLYIAESLRRDLGTEPVPQ